MFDSSAVQRRKGLEEVAGKSSKKPWNERLKKKPSTCWEKYGKYFWRLLLVEFVVIVVAIIVLLSKDSPITPRKILLPSPRPLTGALMPNTILQNAKRLFEGEIVGPESLALLDGNIYASTYDGKIVRIDDDKTLTTIVKLGNEPCGTLADEHICGRPLGLHVSEHGTLYVMDAYLGLFEVNITGEFTELIPSSRTYMGHPIRFGNDVTRLPGGDFFFTDSDFKWQRREFPYSVFESSPNGRLIWFNPVSKFSNVALFDLYFPNGIQLSPNNDFLLICETTGYRILKYHLTGDKSGQKEVFADNLPMTPDNIRPSLNGGYWVATAGPIRDGTKPFILTDYFASMPWLRMQLVKIFDPMYLLSLTPKYGLILELNKDGEIINSLHDPTGKVMDSASEVLDTGEALYIGSYGAPYLIKLDYKSTSRS